MFTWSNKAESKAKSNKNNKKEYKIDEFSDDITCDICFEQYSTDQNDLKSPRILNCGHTFCLECLSKEFEKHNKTIIKCPFDSEDTRLESLSDLTVNVVIIGTIINYAFNKQEMIYKYQNKIDQLQEEIGKEIHVNLKQLDKTWDMLNMHLISIYSVKNKANDLIDGLKKMKNEDTQLLFNLEEYKKLENYLNELKTNEKFYKNLFELVYRRVSKAKLAKLNVIENEFKKTDNIENLVEYHIYISRLKEYVKEILEDDRIKKDPEGLSTLNDIEEKIMKRLEEIEQKFNVEQLLRYIKNKSEGNHKSYRIGILGLMNVGKSSLINRLRGIKDTDVKQGAARVNIDECTGGIHSYTWEENKELEFWDHPGYTSSDVIDKYFQNFLQKKLCDIYIILYNRLEENDVKIAKYIFNTIEKEFLMCRTHSDNHIDQIIRDLDEKNKKISDEEAFNEYKGNSLRVLDREKYNKYFDAKFTRELCKDRTFFISCDRRYHTKYEWKILNERILKLSKPNLAENFAEFSPFTSGKKVIRKKREALEKGIVKLSIASAATDIIPVAGAFADLGIIYFEAKKYQNRFGLTQENFDKMADLFDVKYEERQSISRIIGLDSIYVNIKNLVLLLLGSIPGGIQAISFFVSLSTAASISFPLFAPIAVIMALASAPISYCMTKDVLTKILCQMEYDSFRMIDFLEKKIKIGESDFSYVISKTEKGPEEPDSIICQHEICQVSDKPSKKNCAKCQKTFCSDHCNKIMTIPFKQLPKMHKVCDKCYQETNSAERIEEDANINKLVFKRDSEKCSVYGCNKPFNWKTKKHHCEKCGSCICYDHSRNELKFSIIVLEPEDVCDQCYENEVNN